jgi:hypothetical protein
LGKKEKSGCKIKARDPGQAGKEMIKATPIKSRKGEAQLAVLS